MIEEDEATHQLVQHGLHVEVFAPRDPQPKRFEWAPTLTVGEAARQAATAFGYVGGDPTLRTADGRALDRTRTLEQAGVHDGEKLEVVDAGGGV